MKQSINTLLFLCLLGAVTPLYAQYTFVEKDFTLLELRLYSEKMFHDTIGDGEKEIFPDPKDVMYRSMMIPGWGQVTNKQAWKVPIIYGLFAGIGYYTYELTQLYHDFRAAHYNESWGEDSDFRFGPTPERIPEAMGVNELRSNRDNYRNRRDFMYVVMVLAYGLNVVDAYVYAHMRSFDVSDDLSTIISPELIDGRSPGVNVRVKF